MAVIYPARWQAKSGRKDEAHSLVRAIECLEADLREAGFGLAADLVMAAEGAIWDDLIRRGDLD